MLGSIRTQDPLVKRARCDLAEVELRMLKELQTQMSMVLDNLETHTRQVIEKEAGKFTQATRVHRSDKIMVTGFSKANLRK